MPKQIIWAPLAENDLSAIRTRVEILRIYDTRQDPDSLTF